MTKILLLLGLLGLAYGAQVCYEPYGCFSSDPPFNSAVIPLPQNPKRLGTKFHLYTDSNDGDTLKIVKQTLDPFNKTSLLATNFTARYPTIVVAHGYLGNPSEFWVPKMIDALLTKDGKHNVIVVDWGLGATGVYFQSAGNARLVGQQVKHLLNQLDNHYTDMDFRKVHMIGQGLGAHMLAYAGRDLARAPQNTPVGRISAMDPVGLWFDDRHVDVRLDPTDATWVDVIHTDTETWRVAGVGTKVAMGHVDFFPNGGKSQPGCWKFDQGVVKWVACSHFRAAELYIESINQAEARSCPFRQYYCKNYQDFEQGFCSLCPPNGCPTLGWNSIEDQGQHSGKFFSQTNDKGAKKGTVGKPIDGFCSWHYNIKFLTGSGLFADFDGVVSVTITGDEGGPSETVELPDHYYPAASTETLLIHTKRYHGELLTIKVHTDGLIDSWYLYAVVIRPMWSANAYTGCYKKWMSNRYDEVTLNKGVEANCPSNLVVAQ